jgi:hypothetical protein
MGADHHYASERIQPLKGLAEFDFSWKHALRRRRSNQYD